VLTSEEARRQVEEQRKLDWERKKIEREKTLWIKNGEKEWKKHRLSCQFECWL